MSATWNITLERRINEEQFDRACSEIGLLPNGEVYYDARVVGQDLACVNLGGVEVYFGTGTRDNPISIRACAHDKRYEAMKKTALDLGEKLHFKTIAGEWFDDVSKKPISYSPDVFKQIE